MPSQRVMQYYQYPVSPEFARHMIEGIGLSQRDQEIAWALRQKSGDTQFFADEAAMSIKAYNEAVGRIHRREMEELLRLAQIGYQALQDGRA